MLQPLTIFSSDRSGPVVLSRPRFFQDRWGEGAVVAVILGASLVGFALARGVIWPVAGLGLVVAATLWPVEIALGLFAAVIPFETLLVMRQDGTTLNWGLGAFAGVFLLTYGLIGKRIDMPSRATVWWGAFALWAGSSAAWAWNPAASLRWVPTVLSLFALYLVITSLRLSDRELKRIGQFVVVGGLVAACVLIYESRAMGLRERATLSLGERIANPNEVAESLLLPFGLSIGSLFTAQRGAERVFLFIVTALITAGVFLTMSRSGLIALTVTLLSFLIRGRVRGRALILIPIVVIPLLFMPSIFYSRLESAPTGRGTGRLDIMMVGAKIVAHNPVVGVGLANFGVAYDRYAGYAPIFRGYDRAPHDAYLQAWAETGIVGLTLFLAAVWCQLAAARRAADGRSRDTYFAISVEAACWGLLAMALAGITLWSKAFWLAFMLLAQATRQIQTRGEPGMSSKSRLD